MAGQYGGYADVTSYINAMKNKQNEKKTSGNTSKNTTTSKNTSSSSSAWPTAPGTTTTHTSSSGTTHSGSTSSFGGNTSNNNNNFAQQVLSNTDFSKGYAFGDAPTGGGGGGGQSQAPVVDNSAEIAERLKQLQSLNNSKANALKKAYEYRAKMGADSILGAYNNAYRKNANNPFFRNNITNKWDLGFSRDNALRENNADLLGSLAKVDEQKYNDDYDLLKLYMMYNNN